MSTTHPATLDDVVARWRPLSTQEAANATAFLEDAWDLLLSRRPGLPDQIAGVVTDPATQVAERSVVRVLVSMVLRVLKNPDGYSQESLDDWSGTRAGLVADGLMRVTSEELASLLPTTGSRSRGSVRLVVYGDD